MSEWLLDGASPGDAKQVEFTHAALVIVWRVDDTGKQTIRNATASSGDVHRLPRNGGDFVTRDVSGAGNTVTVEPPAAEQPPLGSATYLPREADEEPVDQQGQEYKYTVTFLRESPIPLDFSGSWTNETQGTGEWLFSLQQGDVATRRVNRDIRKGAAAGIGDRALELVLSADETAVWAESLRYLDAQQDREIADGDSLVADTSENSSNTVTVTPPTGGDRYVPAGDYVVREWVARRINSAYWRVETTLGESS